MCAVCIEAVEGHHYTSTSDEEILKYNYLLRLVLMYIFMKRARRIFTDAGYDSLE